MAGVIDGYLAGPRRELDFDPILARRMGEAVESHLRDAAEADPAVQLATDAVNRQARRTWIALLAAVAVTFIARRRRVMWHADAGDSLSLLAPLIDRYAFLAALAVGSIGWWAARRSVLLLAASGEIALIGLLPVHVVGLDRRLKRTALLRRVG